MSRPPLLVLAIVILNLFGAAGSFFVVDQIGVLGACIEFVVFVAIAIGLWQLKKWAWVLEIAVSSLQIALLLLGIVVALLTLIPVESSDTVSLGQLLALFAALILVNALVVVVLIMPKIRAAFRQPRL